MGPRIIILYKSGPRRRTGGALRDPVGYLRAELTRRLSIILSYYCVFYMRVSGLA